MEKISYIKKTYINNYIKSLFNKGKTGKRKINMILINNFILSFAIIIFIFIQREAIKKFITIDSLISNTLFFYIIYLLLVGYKKVIANLIYSEDYEFYLALPIKLKDIFFAKLIETYVEIILESLFIISTLISMLAIYKVSIASYFTVIFIYFLSTALFILYILMIKAIFFRMNSKVMKKIIMAILIGLFILMGINKIFLLNLFKLGGFLGSIIYIIFLIVGYKILFKYYKNLLNDGLYINIKNENQSKFKMKKINNEISLIKKDLKKILRNSILRQALIINNLIFFIFFIVSLSIFSEIFSKMDNKIFFITFLLINCASIISIATGIPQILFSLEGLDIEFLKTLPIEKSSIVKSKIIVSFFIAIPNLIILLAFNLWIFKESLINILLGLVIILSNYFIFLIIALYEDCKNINIAWINSKDLVEDYGKLFKLLFISLFNGIIIFLFKFIVPIGYYQGIIVVYSFVLLIFYYKKLIKFSENIYKIE